MNLPQGQIKLTKDEQSMSDMLGFLYQGWSLNKSRSLAGLSDKGYKDLRAKYPYFVELLEPFAQNKKKKGYS